MAKSDLVQSVQRALDIVEHIARCDDGERLGDLSENLSLKKPTVHNLVRTLVSRGYLDGDGPGGYRLGPALDDIACSRFGRSLFRAAEASMRRMHSTREAAVLTFAELSGGEIRCRLRMSGDLPGMVQRPQAQTFSAFGSASGLCLQAFNPEFLEAASALQGFDECGGHPWKTREDFDQALRQTTRRGIAVLRGASALRLAAPVDPGHTLGVSFRASELDENELSRQLRESASAIADAIKTIS